MQKKKLNKRFLDSIKHIKYTDTPDAWQSRVQAFLKLPFPLPWLLIACVLFVIGMSIAIYTNENQNAIHLLAIECAVIAALTNSVVFFEKLMDEIADTYPLLLNEDSEKAELWIMGWYKIIYWSKKNLAVGLIVGGILLLSSGYNSAALFHSWTGKLYSFLITFILGFMVGSALWVILGIAGMFASLGKDVKIRSSIFDSRTSVLRTASFVLWKVSLVISLVYLLGISTVYLCDIKLNFTSMLTTVFFGVFIIVYYVVPQVNIHKFLVELKRSRLKVLVEQIDRSFDKVSSAPTPENISQLRDLFHLQNIVNGKRSWSFGAGELLMLIGSIIIPLMLFFINYFIRGLGIG